MACRISGCAGVVRRQGAAVNAMHRMRHTKSLLLQPRWQSSQAEEKTKQNNDSQEVPSEISSLVFHLNCGRRARLKFEFQLGEIVSLFGLLVAVAGLNDWIQKKMEDRKAEEVFSKQGLDLALQETNFSLNVIEPNGRFGLRTLLVAETRELFPHPAQMKALHHAAQLQKPASEPDDDEDTFLDRIFDWVEEITGIDLDSDGIVGAQVAAEERLEHVRPYLYLEDEEKAARLRRQIKGKISEMGSGSHLAEDMGLPVVNSKYIWGMTYEYLDRTYHERKLRLFIAHRDLLENLSQRDANDLEIPRGGTEQRRQYYRDRLVHLQTLWRLYREGQHSVEARKGLLIGDIEISIVGAATRPRTHEFPIRAETT